MIDRWKQYQDKNLLNMRLEDQKLAEVDGKWELSDGGINTRLVMGIPTLERYLSYLGRLMRAKVPP